jgi:hypothetical protein
MADMDATASDPTGEIATLDTNLVCHQRAALKCGRLFSVYLGQVLELAQRSWPFEQQMSQFQVDPRDVRESDALHTPFLKEPQSNEKQAD